MNAREISLTQNQVAIVDEGDYKYLSQFHWYAHWNANTREGCDESATDTPDILLGDEMAKELETAFDVPAQFFLNLHESWRKEAAKTESC